jgi:histidine triad (HIT) family protein
VNASEKTSCPFCAIADGNDTSVEVVCEGNSWLAFFPLDPATPGHTLVIPRAHVSDFWAAEKDVVIDVSLAARRVGRAMLSALSPEGLNLITSAGNAAEQTVFHFHMHVVPRWARDGFGAIWPVHEKRYEDRTLENIAGRLRAACESED